MAHPLEVYKKSVPNIFLNLLLSLADTQTFLHTHAHILMFICTYIQVNTPTHLDTSIIYVYSHTTCLNNTAQRLGYYSPVFTPFCSHCCL